MEASVTAFDFFNASTVVQELFRVTTSSTLSAPSKFRFFVVMAPALQNNAPTLPATQGSRAPAGLAWGARGLQLSTT